MVLTCQEETAAEMEWMDERKWVCLMVRDLNFTSTTVKVCISG